MSDDEGSWCSDGDIEPELHRFLAQPPIPDPEVERLQDRVVPFTLNPIEPPTNSTHSAQLWICPGNFSASHRCAYFIDLRHLRLHEKQRLEGFAYPFRDWVDNLPRKHSCPYDGKLLNYILSRQWTGNEYSILKAYKVLAQSHFFYHNLYVGVHYDPLPNGHIVIGEVFLNDAHRDMIAEKIMKQPEDTPPLDRRMYEAQSRVVYEGRASVEDLQAVLPGANLTVMDLFD